MKNKAETACILTVVVGILLIFVSYLYIYKPNVQKTADLEASNQQLQLRVDELRGFYEKMPEYKEKNAFMEEDILKKLDEFPIDVKDEDVIHLALRTWEEGIPTGYTTILVGERKELGVVNEEIVVKGDVDGLEKALTFKERTGTYDNMTTYTYLKDLLASMNDGQEQLAINKISYTLNEESKMLEGSIECKYYMVDGINKPYVPKDFKEYELGVLNLFGSVELR